MGKMGIFGGTFDPVHWGHLLIAQSALSQMGLEQVIWVPNYPHYKQASPFEHRLEMVARAIASNPAFTTFSSPDDRSTGSYAIQTLIELQAAYPNTDWYWIVGLDTFQTLPGWYRRQEIATACNWIVAPRLGSIVQNEAAIAPNHSAGEFVAQQLAAQGIDIKWQVLQMPIIGVSSSLIRQYCCTSHSIRYLVAEPVRIYIATHNLYTEERGVRGTWGSQYR